MSKNDNTENIEEELSQEQMLKQEELNGERDQEDIVEEEMSEEDRLREDLGKEKDKFLRLFAEFENYKKRTSKERMDLFKTAGQEVIVSLLPVLDDFDRALKELSKAEDKELFKGVELIKVKFWETLKSKGLQEVEVTAGDTFDAEIHEAITQIPAPEDSMKGKVIDVIEKGFKLGERIIRHPKVVVGN
ncbi:nucleotide exchange factor GrpE [Maribacter cobaltidurans]|uniref:Protein GrpE n=1 Tax=Maribacter cobaltidurans TaxID=1178778 RepID=A0A223VB82_9FLAO|nr:nucleotide exchange factor GrpE [Maribacter cobaltidurans]ASV32517.1 nucleotide exchange factor GrpE [Maribacter cobaltidurans]GGD71601.1 protein GrpE [Maribacter cobaltidurans]